MQKAKLILVVDDSAAIRAFLGAVLAAAGHEVVTVDSARAALRQLRTLRPALILTDYAMPGLDGHAFVRLVRRNVRLAGIPVLVVSSETARAKRGNMFQAGVEGWLAKPIDPIALLTLIEDAARPRRRCLGPRFGPARRAGERTLTSGAHRLSLYVFMLISMFTNNGGSAAILGQP